MKHIKISFWFVLFFSIGLFASALEKKDGEKFVYVDGIYDIGHYGHAKSFSKARAIAAKHFNIPEEKIKIIVGICGGDLKSYKREPVFTSEQRALQIMSFKGVDAVIRDAPIDGITDRLLDEEHIDMVMHGDDFSPEKIEKYYGVAVKRGIFKTFPYEPGISTLAIIKRASLLSVEGLRDNKLSSKERNAVNLVLKLLKE